jgi:ribose transport system ATP-binding protein
MIFKNGKRIKLSDYPKALRALCAVYLPEDRKGKGLVVSFDAQTNYSLLGLQRFGAYFVNRRAERAAFKRAIEQLQIKIPDRSMPVNRLSGGNQQKVVLAKVLATEPEIIVFDEPTRGIDVGTKAQIYHLIAAMAAEGRSCVVISSELLEIIGLCHRVIVMRASRIVASLEGDAIAEDEIMMYATGLKQAHSPFDQ